MNKLDLIGVRGTDLKIFKDFLCDRKQHVKINKQISSMANVVYGFPQGSVLGPSLFMLYINDLYLQTLWNGKTFMYADNTAVVFHGGA